MKGSFLEGLIFGGAYLRREINFSKSIGLALQLEINLPFLLCFTLYLRAIFQVQAPGGLILGGAYFRNFTVYVFSHKKTWLHNDVTFRHCVNQLYRDV